MKKQLFLLFVSLVALTVSCTEGDSDLTTGDPYDILVVADKPLWEGAVGDTLRVIMNEEVEWINRQEPIFDLANVTHKAMNRTLKRFRNIIFVSIDPELITPTLHFEDNKWVPGQALVAVTASSTAAAAKVISDYREKIVDYFSTQELKRLAARATKFSQKNITELISEKFGFEMSIPRGYTVALDTTDVLWMLYEMPVKYQGIVIYSFSSDSDDINVIAQRDSAVGVIEGVNAGSYMTTDKTFFSSSEVVEIAGTGWIETRGFWRLENGFMGGPFVNYITYDELSDKYIGVDLFVFAPKVSDKHRNSVRQMESLMNTVKFPELQITLTEF